VRPLSPRGAVRAQHQAAAVAGHLIDRPLHVACKAVLRLQGQAGKRRDEGEQSRRRKRYRQATRMSANTAAVCDKHCARTASQTMASLSCCAKHTTRQPSSSPSGGRASRIVGSKWALHRGWLQTNGETFSIGEKRLERSKLSDYNFRYASYRSRIWCLALVWKAMCFGGIYNTWAPGGGNVRIISNPTRKSWCDL
jgi:hypothetical protein